MAWWEARRLPYNAIVGVIGLVSGASMLTVAYVCARSGGAPIGLPDPPLLAVVGVLAYGIGANVCYTGGWVTELLIARFWGVQTERFGPIAFTLGTVFSAIVTLAPAGLVIAVAAGTACRGFG